MPQAAGGPLDRWRVVGIPGCRTHARQPRAPTYRHVHAKTLLWVKIGRVRKSTFHFQCVLPRALRRAATSATIGGPSFVLFPPSSLIRRAALCFRAPPLPSSSSSTPPPPPRRPTRATVCFSAEGIPLCLNGRARFVLFLMDAGY